MKMIHPAIKHLLGVDTSVFWETEEMENMHKLKRLSKTKKMAMTTDHFTILYHFVGPLVPSVVDFG